MNAPPKKAAIRYFGDYVLLGEIARGGMGVVYRALQTSLDREVAVKMIDAGKLASEAAVCRFHTEAEAMAKLDHPNIVSIHEIGEHDGQHYFTMQLVDGANLAEYVASKQMEPRRAAEFLVTVSRAVQYAHEHGVLHRDLKPSNILLDAEGQPHITDFGIAKLVERGDGLTGSLAMLGTPEYMAPEQAVGKARQVTTAADIYGLGAVLYYLLTGKPPFKGETPLETLDKVIKQKPISLRSLNPALDHRLEVICLRCLEKEASRRYRTASALALDLQQWLSRHNVPAQPSPFRQRLSVSVAAAAAMLVLALGIAALLLRSSSLENRKTHNSLKDFEATSASLGSTLTQDLARIDVTNVAREISASNPEVRPGTNIVLKTTLSGIVREKIEQNPDGSKRLMYFSLTGRIQKEELQKLDGTKQTTYFGFNGKPDRKETIHSDGTREVISFQVGHDGKVRVEESINYDKAGHATARSVAMKQTAIIANKSTLTSNSVIVRNYTRGPFGFEYRPVHTTNLALFLSWYDPHWNVTPDIPSLHPFRYQWGWVAAEWYRGGSYYWTTSPVYQSPGDWLADWLIASYVADRYAASPSAAQAREDARFAREDAERAGFAARQAQTTTEADDARAVQAGAERRTVTAQGRVAKVEAEEARLRDLAGKRNPKATPIDTEIKQALKNQIEGAIAEEKKVAEQFANGGERVLPNLSKALANPRYLYPVSRQFSVASAKDFSAAGTLTEGDLLMLEPGQEAILKNANENTFVTMRVLTSKGEEGEVTAGTLIKAPLRVLQDFDAEFRAKLDLGLAEANENKDLFKQGSK